MGASPHCKSYFYADRSTLYISRAFVELESRVVYRGLEPAIRDLKAQEIGLKSIYE